MVDGEEGGGRGSFIELGGMLLPHLLACHEVARSLVQHMADSPPTFHLQADIAGSSLFFHIATVRFLQPPPLTRSTSHQCGESWKDCVPQDVGPKVRFVNPPPSIPLHPQAKIDGNFPHIGRLCLIVPEHTHSTGYHSTGAPTLASLAAASYHPLFS